MRQIIPFKKDLLFKTKVSEVTSISLEHNFNIVDDNISGDFIISGEYKMTDGSINREKFDFKLPFDITLNTRYKEDSLVVDIDNFYYKIINNDTLEVNIDLYVDGQQIVLEEAKDEKDDIKFEDIVDELELNEEVEEDKIERGNDDIEERNDDIIDNDNSLKVENININNNVSKDFNIFGNVDESETYKAYYVYIVKESDTIDSIIEKYNTTKEELSLYNNIESITVGDKIIIPSKNE